ncbi:MAG: hypothetical protein ABSB36_00615 [Candidatus Dormibacteria bacterium]
MSSQHPQGGRPPLEERERHRRHLFGVLLKELMGGEKQEDLAARLQLRTGQQSWTQERVSKVIHGRLPLSLELIEDVAYTFRRSVGWVLASLYQMPLTPEDHSPIGDSSGHDPMFKSREEFERAVATSWLMSSGSGLLPATITRRVYELNGRMPDPSTTAVIVAMARMDESRRQDIRTITEALAGPLSGSADRTDEVKPLSVKQTKRKQGRSA